MTWVKSSCNLLKVHFLFNKVTGHDKGDCNKRNNNSKKQKSKMEKPKNDFVKSYIFSLASDTWNEDYINKI